MVPLAHKQAKDHLAETPLVRQRHFKKTHADRGWTNGTDHRSFNPNGLVRLIGLQDQSEKRPAGQTRRLQRTPVHRNIGNAVCRLHPIVGEKLRLDRRRQPLVLAAIEGLRALAGLSVKRAELIHAELAAEGKEVQLIQDALHCSILMGHPHERRAAIWTVECLHAPG
jgi:hypothetical protein